MSNTDGKKMSIIVTKGTLDWAYPPFILATTAASLGVQVTLFFTFYGLQLLKKDLGHLKISTLGNPGMEMPMGGMHMSMPNVVSMLPGVDSMASSMMKGLMKKKGVASLEDLREATQDLECRMIACQMTVDLFELKQDQLIDGLEYAGAATWVEVATDSEINLFI